MNDNRMLDERAIGDIILCDPITRRGKACLGRLGLTLQDISPSFFYKHLRVESKFDESKGYKVESSPQVVDQKCLYYQYTVDSEQFKIAKDRLKDFNARFSSDIINEYPLLMLGVAGNGKSIEINRRIRKIADGETDSECGRVYVDLEDSFTKITYGYAYQVPDCSPLWLFCIKLLDGIMRYIKQCHSYCPNISKNFNNTIKKSNLATKEQIQLFHNIGKYCYGNNEAEGEIFKSLTNLLTPPEVEKKIQILLEVLMWIMYCSDTNRKHYIVIDNIEQYIKLSSAKIQIPNSDISKIYKSINAVVSNLTNDFERIESDLAWKAFKIIVVLRRTSIGLLDSTMLHTPVKKKQNVNDVTGHFQVSDIWREKKKHIWNDRLCSQFDSRKSKDIIDIIDLVMNDGTKAAGTDYQSIIAPLMSFGIRRNARSQAHSIYSTYEMLTRGRNETINLEEFKLLMDAGSSFNPTVRYMFRRALLEFQFKWPFLDGNHERWRDLNIGHLTGAREIRYEGQRITAECVDYNDPQYVTLMRRILSYLSYFPDADCDFDNGKMKSVVDMFATRSLYDLIKGVLINPTGKNVISDQDYLQLSRVLIALSDMSNSDTRSAPYVILGVNNAKFHMNPSETVLAKILRGIWEAGSKKSLPGEKYDCKDFGVRINDAGYSFLLDWQPSFSFMASLHCFTIPSLFFLKNVLSIKYVISTVYKCAFQLCKMYEAEAKRFCGNGVTLKTGKYLPKINGEYVTFRQRVKELHINHLTLYRAFIEKNYSILGISQEEMYELTAQSTGFIYEYINKYNGWKTGKGAPECF